MRITLTMNEKNAWNEWFNKLPVHLQDVNYCATYYEIYENNGYGKAECYIYTINDNFVFYPYLKNFINISHFNTYTTYYDIQGAYGLNGPLSTSDDPLLIESFSKDFTVFCKENKIIAEFVRFNPLFANHSTQNYLEPIYSNDVIVIDLSDSESEIWNTEFDSETRGSIRKAIKNQLSYIAFTGKDLSDYYMKEFVNLYHQTMERNNADDYYYFSKKFFSDIKRNLKNNTSFMFALYNGNPIATSLNIYMNNNAYGFLAGNKKEYLKLQPSSFLIYHSCLELKLKGVKKFHLGGGTIKEDNIYKFKKGFNRNGSLKFYIGKKIYYQKEYNLIVQNWETLNPEKKLKYNNYLLKYRF
jgi:lipid II:glycine glycyltransferase (peptidoglycan interpeptide bridge formation enzyme)